MDLPGGRSKETTMLEVRLSPDGRRLLLVQWHTQGANFWVHPDGNYSYVPTERDIITLKMAYEAIDSFNKEQMFKRNIKLNVSTSSQKRC